MSDITQATNTTMPNPRSVQKQMQRDAVYEQRRQSLESTDSIAREKEE
jgi:U3 small nucleolar RNA-associated protein 14